MAPTGGFGGWFGLWRACPSGCHMGACLSSPPAEVGFGDISTTPSKHFDTAVELDGMVEVPPQVGLAKEPPRPCALPPGRVPRQRRGCVTHTHIQTHTYAVYLSVLQLRAGGLAGWREGFLDWCRARKRRCAAAWRGAARAAALARAIGEQWLVGGRVAPVRCRLTGQQVATKVVVLTLA